MYKFILALSFSFAFHLHAGQRILQGQELNNDYLFALNDEWQDVQGSWGRLNYSLAWDSDYKILEGKTAGEEQNLEFNLYSQRISGSTRCGYINLQFSTHPNTHRLSQINGELCNQSLNIEFDSELSFKKWLKESLLKEMTSEFPNPVQAEIVDFFADKIILL